MLHSKLAGYDIDEQTFQISFRDADDLTERIVSIMAPGTRADPTVAADEVVAG